MSVGFLQCITDSVTSSTYPNLTVYKIFATSYCRKNASLMRALKTFLFDMIRAVTYANFCSNASNFLDFGYD